MNINIYLHLYLYLFMNTKMEERIDVIDITGRYGKSNKEILSFYVHNSPSQGSSLAHKWT